MTLAFFIHNKIKTNPSHRISTLQTTENIYIRFYLPLALSRQNKQDVTPRNLVDRIGLGTMSNTKGVCERQTLLTNFVCKTMSPITSLKRFLTQNVLQNLFQSKTVQEQTFDKRGICSPSI